MTILREHKIPALPGSAAIHRVLDQIGLPSRRCLQADSITIGGVSIRCVVVPRYIRGGRIAINDTM